MAYFDVLSRNLSGVIEENLEIRTAVLWPRFEPGASRRVKCSAHSTATFGPVSVMLAWGDSGHDAAMVCPREFI
jgi:hypothetical protein